MQNSYDFVGGPLDGQRKDLNPSDFPVKAEGGSYHLTGGGHSVNGSPMVYTALFRPEHEAVIGPGGAPIKVGDPFRLDMWNVGDCPGEKVDATGFFTAFCVLEEGHSPVPHIATDGTVVVEVWD